MKISFAYVASAAISGIFSKMLSFVVCSYLPLYSINTLNK
jgi:hypothetical protein